MLCTKCSGPTKVIKTIPFERYTARERQCRSCFHRHLSLEAPMDETGNFETPQVMRDLKLGGRYEAALPQQVTEAPPVPTVPRNTDDISDEALEARLRELGVK